MGLSIAQQMMQQQGGLPVLPPEERCGGPAATSGLPEILTPDAVAKVLGVTEADVIATIEAGDLKGKKIGSTYRVTRAALDEFLKH